MNTYKLFRRFVFLINQCPLDNVHQEYLIYPHTGQRYTRCISGLVRSFSATGASTLKAKLYPGEKHQKLAFFSVKLAQNGLDWICWNFDQEEFDYDAIKIKLHVNCISDWLTLWLIQYTFPVNSAVYSYCRFWTGISLSWKPGIRGNIIQMW